MRTKEDIQLLKEIWAIVISQGRLVQEYLKSSFYGGWQCPEYPPGTTHKKIKEMMVETQSYPQKIKEIGVDWEKTEPPEYKLYSEFVGTGDTAAEVETWEGILVLKDGTRIKGVCEEGHSQGEIKVRVSRLTANNSAKDIQGLISKHFGE